MTGLAVNSSGSETTMNVHHLLVVTVALGKHLCGTKPIIEAFQGHFHTHREIQVAT